MVVGISVGVGVNVVGVVVGVGVNVGGVVGLDGIGVGVGVVVRLSRVRCFPVGYSHERRLHFPWAVTAVLPNAVRVAATLRHASLGLRAGLQDSKG